MPFVEIVGPEEIDIDKKREMVKKVSEIVAEAYDLPTMSLSVIVQGLPDENVAYGGQLISDVQPDKTKESLINEINKGN